MIDNVPALRANGWTWDAAGVARLDELTDSVCALLAGITEGVGSPDSFRVHEFVTYRVVRQITEVVLNNTEARSAPPLDQLAGDLAAWPAPPTEEAFQNEIRRGSDWYAALVGTMSGPMDFGSAGNVALDGSFLTGKKRTPTSKRRGLPGSPPTVAISGSSLPIELRALVALLSRFHMRSLDLAARSSLVVTATSPEQRLGLQAILEDGLASRGNEPWLARNLANVLALALPSSKLEGFRANLDGNWAVLAELAGIETVICQPPARDHLTFLLGCLSAQGTDLIFLQHGGEYFESIPAAWEAFEVHHARLYGYWGHVETEGTALPPPVALAPPRLLRLSGIRGALQRLRGLRSTYSKDQPGRLLWVSNEADNLVTDLDTLVCHLDGAVAELQQGVAEVLGARRDGPWLLRRKPKTTDWKRSSFVWDGPVDEGPHPVDGLLQRADLVLVDYLFSSTFLECLAQDVPCLIVAPANTPLRDRVLDAYQALQRAGIWCTSVNDLQRTLDEIERDGPARFWDDRRDAVEQAHRVLVGMIRCGGRSWLRLALRVGAGNGEQYLKPHSHIRSGAA